MVNIVLSEMKLISIHQVIAVFYGIRVNGNKTKIGLNKIQFNGLGNYVIGSDVSVAGIQLYGLSNTNSRIYNNEVQWPNW